MMTSIVNKFETSLTGDARVIIYDCYMFVVQIIFKGYARTNHHTALFREQKLKGKIMYGWPPHKGSLFIK